MTTKLRKRDRVMVHHLEMTWRRARVETRDPYLSVDREERIFSSICDLDPAGGVYLDWLSGWRRRSWNDIGFLGSVSLSSQRRIAHALDAFHRAAPYLAVGCRDIGSYREIDEVIGAADSMTEGSRRRMRAARRQEALAQSATVFDDAGWSLIRLEGPAAAQWWGLGTRWCTAASGGGHYERYAARTDLLVLKSPAGKFQLAVDTGEFRDEADAIVDPAQILLIAPSDLRSMLTSIIRFGKRPERQSIRSGPYGSS